MSKSFAEMIGVGFRDKEKLVPSVARYLMKLQEVDDYAMRGLHAIHPSEAAKEMWCPRSTYYRISGVQADQMPRSLAMEMVFETGSEAHRKWQGWFRRMGVLKGNWYCQACGLLWYDTSPYECPRCEVGGDLIIYAEVPVADSEHLLLGQADGDVVREEGSDVLIEIKTIGANSVRVEAPALVEQYSYVHVDDEGKQHSGVDWQQLWTGIRRPFPSHLRQGMLYLYCTGRKEIVYLYDPKFLTAWPKEFEVKYRHEIIEDILTKCLVVRRALEAERPPKRPHWAEPAHKVCQACPYRATCWDHGGSATGHRG